MLLVVSFFPSGYTSSKFHLNDTAQKMKFSINDYSVNATKSIGKGNSSETLHKWSHLFICISLKQTLSSRQKLIWHENVRTNSLAAIFYFDKVLFSVGLINKDAYESFLLITCKEHTLTMPINFLSINHPILCFWLRREGRQMSSAY